MSSSSMKQRRPARSNAKNEDNSLANSGHCQLGNQGSDDDDGADGVGDIGDVESSGCAKKDDSDDNDNSGSGGRRDERGTKYEEWKERKKSRVPKYYKLATEAGAKAHSINSVCLSIVISSVNMEMLMPNYAIMCSPGASPESFPSTRPFGFNAATYFLPMATLLGSAFSSVLVGRLSDAVGTKKVMLAMSWLTAAGALVKFFARRAFWGFAAACFVFGFFLSHLPVAMAYAGHVEPDERRRNRLLGIMVGCCLFGEACGGVLAVLMNDAGLFSPLLLGGGLMAFSALMLHLHMIDSRQLLQMQHSPQAQHSPQTQHRLEQIETKTMWNILLGALFDNIGSSGLFPLCLSPLALQTFYESFASKGQDPIMSITSYQWISVCVSLLILPSVQLTPHVFARLGVAGTCVFSNIVAASIMGLLVWIATFSPTNLTFGIFVLVLCLGYPVTIFSQLTTGPMLDLIAPEEKIGYVQGLGDSSMNFGMALAPWGFGILADFAGTNAAIATAIGFSLLAAIINSPLMWHAQMGRPVAEPTQPQLLPEPKRYIDGEDQELISKILDGSYIDPEIIHQINKRRGFHHKSALIPRIRNYDEEKDNLDELQAHARSEFKYQVQLHDDILSDLATAKHDPQNSKFTMQELCDIFNAVTRGADTSLIDESAIELGMWMGRYLQDNGYHPHMWSVLLKQMFMTAYPSLSKQEVTPETIEQVILRGRRVMAQFVAQEEKSTMSLTDILSKRNVFHA